MILDFLLLLFAFRTDWSNCVSFPAWYTTFSSIGISVGLVPSLSGVSVCSSALVVPLPSGVSWCSLFKGLFPWP